MIEARLTNDLKLILYDTEKEKEIKSFPKKGVDPVKREAAEAKFKAMKRNTREIVKNRVNLLKRQFLSGENIQVDEWTESYLKNPVLIRIAQLMVWAQGDHTFTVSNGQTIMVDGTPYALTGMPLRVAHPVEMDAHEVSAWQRYFLNNSLKQPFAQAWEAVAVQDINSVLPDRYERCEISVGNVLGMERQELVKYRYSYDTPVQLEFAGKMWINGFIEKKGNWLTEYGPDNKIVLGEIENLRVIEPRKLNRVIAILDKITVVPHIIQDNDEWLGTILTEQTPAQINDYLKIAIDNGASRCTALLLEYKHLHFSEYEEINEFTLDW